MVKKLRGNVPSHHLFQITVYTLSMMAQQSVSFLLSLFAFLLTPSPTAANKLLKYRHWQGGVN